MVDGEEYGGVKHVGGNKARDTPHFKSFRASRRCGYLTSKYVKGSALGRDARNLIDSALTK